MDTYAKNLITEYQEVIDKWKEIKSHIFWYPWFNLLIDSFDYIGSNYNLKSVDEKKGQLEELEAIIAADGSVKHERVVGLIDLIKTEGITKFALNTQADFSDPASVETEEAAEEKTE